MEAPVVRVEPNISLVGIGVETTTFNVMLDVPFVECFVGFEDVV